MKIVIVGPGAMGCLYAFLLKQAGYDVWLFDRNAKRAQAIKSQGLTVEGKAVTRRIPFQHITVDPFHIGTADLVIIFVKAYDTETAIKDVRAIITDSTTILTLQNGLGNVEKINKFFPKEQIIAGTTAHGATLLEEGHIRHAGVGETIIGAIDSGDAIRAESIKKVFEGSGIITSIAKNIDGVLWGKLLINAAINPLTGILRIKNGQILRYPDLIELMHNTVQEGLSIAENRGICIPYDSPQKKVEQVCNLTAENRSSMLQDIESGKKTEIEQINGAIVKAGREADIHTPINSVLTDLIQSIEQLRVRQ